MPYKTIEERAKEHVPDTSDVDLSLPTMEGYIVNALQDAYIEGATEQKAIDDDLLREVKKMVVAKACEWFADYLIEIGYPDDWMRDSPNMESGEMRFRKAMEE